MKSLAPIIVLLLAGTAFAADKYVRPNSFASGANNGNDWNNAYRGFGSVTWTAGNTYWLAAGNYTSRISPTANNVTIKRAIASDTVPVAAGGWNSSFDSQVIVSNAATDAMLTLNSVSGVTVDGRTRAGIWVYCPNIYNNGNGSRGFTCRFYSDITLRNIEVAGPFSGTNGINVYDDVRPFDHYNYGSGLIVSNCQFHGGSSVMFLRYATNAVIVDSSFGDSHNLNYSTATDFILGGTNYGNYHQNLCQMEACSGVVFSRDYFYNWEVEGFMVLSYCENVTWDNCVMNSNPDWTVSRFLEFQAACGDFHVKNCTFANVPYGDFIRQIASAGSGSSYSNNIGINLAGGSGNIQGFGKGFDDYNLTDSAADIPGAHSISNATSSVFENYSALWSASPNNFVIVTNIGALYPRQKGADMGSIYATDYAGNTHGADGAWAIGAFEAVAPAPAPPPVRVRVWR